MLLDFSSVIDIKEFETLGLDRITFKTKTKNHEMDNNKVDAILFLKSSR